VRRARGRVERWLSGTRSFLVSDGPCMIVEFADPRVGTSAVHDLPTCSHNGPVRLLLSVIFAA